VVRNNDLDAAEAAHSNSGMAKRMADIQWDYAPLRPLEALGMSMFDDAFIITDVDLDSARNVAFVANLVPVLSTYCNVRRTREINLEERVALVAAMRELTEFLFDNGTAFRQRQKQLRNFRLIELFIEMLKVPFAPYNKSASGVKFSQVCEGGLTYFDSSTHGLLF
jgi:hypothetical protein